MGRFLICMLAMAAQETKPARGEAKWILETTVKGKLTADFTGQDYPFAYEGWTTLTADEVDRLGKEGDVPEALAKRLAGAFAEPEPAKKEGAKDPRAEDPKTIDEISDVSFTVKEGKLKGKLTLVRKEGPGTRKMVLELSGKIEREKLTLAADSMKVSGTWDWGGGVVDLAGKLEKGEGATRAPKK